MRHVLLALVASGFADGFLPVALSFAVLRLTGSVGRLGLVLAAQSAAALLLTLAGGLVGDRFSRGHVLCVSLALRTAVAVVLAATLLTASASFALLLTMSAVYGCADGFFGPASVALLPDVVPLDRLIRANALAGGATGALRIAAPAMAGIIVAALGPGSAFVFQAAVLAAAVGFLVTARLSPVAHAPEPTASPLGQLRDGWAEFARHRWLWLLTGQWAVFSLVILAPVAVLGPPIALHHLGGPGAWGLVSSGLALGAVGGQVIAGRTRLPGRPALIMACLVPLMTAEALALGLGASLPVVAVAAGGSGMAFGLQAVIFPTAMQSAIPARALSRVTAIDLLGSEGGQPIGYALAGPVGQAAGAHAVLAAASISMFVASAAFACLPSLRAKHGKAPCGAAT